MKIVEHCLQLQNQYQMIQSQAKGYRLWFLCWRCRCRCRWCRSLWLFMCRWCVLVVMIFVYLFKPPVTLIHMSVEKCSVNRFVIVYTSDSNTGYVTHTLIKFSLLLELQSFVCFWCKFKRIWWITHCDVECVGYFGCFVCFACFVCKMCKLARALWYLDDHSWHVASCPSFPH